MRPFDPQQIPAYAWDILPYLAVTIAVTAATVLCGSLLGALLAYGKISGGRVQRALSSGYTYVMRCTPSVVLLFIVFYGLPKFFLEVFAYDINDLSRGVFVVITFTLLYAASSSEVMRAAYNAVDRGQYEAAVSVGLSPWRALQRVVLPQAAVVALPNFGNSVLNLLKEGSLAYTIGLVDLLGAGQLIVARAYGGCALEVYIAVGAIYWTLAVLLEKSFLHLERRFSPQNRRRQAEEVR